MADNDPNLADAADYDLVPVDHVPQFADAPIPKAGQQLPPQVTSGDVSGQAGELTKSILGNVTGLSDAYRALSGQMTPEEQQQMFVMALPGLIPGARAETTAIKAAEEAAPFAARMFHGSPVTDLTAIKAVLPAARQFDNATSQLGAWFAPTEQAAQRYAGNTGRVYTTNLSLSKPYEMPWSEFNYLQSPHKGPEGETLPGEQWAARADQLKEEAATRRDELKSAGYDGIVVRNTKGQPVEVASFGDVPLGIRAYHGSPYDFDQFDLSKIGTGEGAQAYGHGLYFAENPGVAGTYKRPGMHSYIQQTEIDSKPLNQFAPQNDVEARAVDALARNPTIDEAVKYLQQDKGTEAAQKWLTDNAGRIKDANQIGKMYEVNINADPEHFLDWDKPLSEQSPKVQDAIAKLAPTDDRFGRAQAANYTGEQLHTLLSGYPERRTAGSQSNATEQLRDAGIPGIKYLDQGSRNFANMKVEPVQPGEFAGKVGEWRATLPNGSSQYFPTKEAAQAFANQGTKNYVVFNDKLIDIVKKYGLAGVVGAGASHFQTVPVDHQPDFGDQQGMATGGVVQDKNKTTKKEAAYRGGNAKKRCGICSMYVPPSSCTAVRGIISPWAVCKFFERKK